MKICCGHQAYRPRLYLFEVIDTKIYREYHYKGVKNNHSFMALCYSLTTKPEGFIDAIISKLFCSIWNDEFNGR